MKRLLTERLSHPSSKRICESLLAHSLHPQMSQDTFYSKKEYYTDPLDSLKIYILIITLKKISLVVRI